MPRLHGATAPALIAVGRDVELFPGRSALALSSAALAQLLPVDGLRSATERG